MGLNPDSIAFCGRAGRRVQSGDGLCIPYLIGLQEERGACWDVGSMLR